MSTLKGVNINLICEVYNERVRVNQMLRSLYWRVSVYTRFAPFTLGGVSVNHNAHVYTEACQCKIRFPKLTLRALSADQAAALHTEGFQ